MHAVLKGLAVITVGLATSTSYAMPLALVTHNRTNVESNAYVNGTIPSAHPTKANSDGKVSWALVKIACFGHAKAGQCPALIKMETNTNHPVDLGTVYLNLNTGEISPKTLSANGYTFTVNGIAESTLSKD